MTTPFLLGCHGRGGQLIPGEPVTVDECFRLIKEAGVFDYIDRLPQPGQENEYLRAAEKHGLPIKSGLWMYRLGKDEALLPKNLRIAKGAGGEIHNIMVYTHHADGHALGDAEVADFYLYAYDEAGKAGIEIDFEIHIEMWSEDFRRVLPVARAVRERGVPFNAQLDHSHCVLKMESAEEQDISGIREDVEAGRLVLDPFARRSIYDEWLEADILVWASLRAVAPNGPKNLWAKHPDGRQGRACQYPFVKPRPGEWHSPWHPYKLEPSKEITRKVLRHIRDNPKNRIRYLTTEFIDLPDYGKGAKYSLIEQNAAAARWIRATWEALKAEKRAA
ncbi:MAG: xylose isomerase [Betaproteobacteria bacterium]